MHCPLLLYRDSQSARDISSNSFHERINHIEMDCHIVREKLQQNLFHHIADLYTKVLVCPPHNFIFKLGLTSIYSPALREY